MAVSRRKFIIRTTLATAGGVAAGRIAGAEKQPVAIETKERPLLVSTWGFGKPANEAGLLALEKGGSPLDAVEQGVSVVEASANSSVGLGGTPNSAGVVQLDAC